MEYSAFITNDAMLVLGMLERWLWYVAMGNKWYKVACFVGTLSV